MKCDKIEDMLSPYLDGSLEEDKAAEVERHLADCGSCTEQYLEMKEISELLGQTEMVPVPDVFRFRLREALKEEKEAMVRSGLIEKPSEKKRRWRMITSVAAVFAVGVISFGLYQDVLDILPDKMYGGGQTGAASEEKGNDEGASGVMDDNTLMMKEIEDKSLATADGSAPVSNAEENGFLRSQSSLSLTSRPETPSAVAGGQGQDDLYGVIANSAPSSDEASGSGELDEDSSADSLAPGEEPATDPEMAVSEGPAADGASPKFKNGTGDSECSRSMPFSGVERNTAATQYYEKKIKERLEGFDYQILESAYGNTGEWCFRVFIFRGKDGNTYNEEIKIYGKDGEVEVICTNEFMGL